MESEVRYTTTIRQGLRALLLMVLLTSPEAWSASQDSAGRLRCVDLPASEHSVCAHEFNPGAEQTVVLIHGLGGNPVKDWEEQLPYLAQHYHVLSLQLSGFYRVSEEARDKGTAALTQALYQLTQRHARGPVILLAHSMGGVIGLRYAIEYPERVSHLVLADVAGVLQRIAFTRSLIKHRQRSEGEGELFNRVLEKLITKILFRMDGYSAEIAAQHQPLDDDPFPLQDEPESWSAFLLIDEDFSQTISTLSLPVLIVWGENDRIAPLRTGYTLAARLPVAQLLIIPQAGHLPMKEKPDVFNRALQEFFSRSPSLRRPDQAYPQERSAAQEEVVCRGEKGREFSGSYRRIVLNDCDEAVIRNANVGELVVNASRLTILHSKVGGGAFGLSATGSEVEITASRIEGEVALLTSRSFIDMAAVTLVGTRTAVQGKLRSNLLFSLSHLQGPAERQSVHGYFTVDRDHSL